MNKSKEIASHAACGQSKGFTARGIKSNIVAGVFFFFFLEVWSLLCSHNTVVMQEKIRVIRPGGAGCKLIIAKEGISPQPPFFFGFFQCLRINITQLARSALKNGQYFL